MTPTTSRSAVVSLRVSGRALLAWEYLCTRERLSVKEFIVTAVEQYLHPERPPRLHGEEFFAPMAVTPPTEKQTITIRVPRDLLAAWDTYCDVHYLSRTGLVRLATDRVFEPPGTRHVTPDYYRACRSVLLNLVQLVGILDFDDLGTIFDQAVDRGTLLALLWDLEARGEIMRKGSTSYTTTTTRKRPVDERRMLEIFSQFVEHTKSDPGLVDANTIRYLVLRVFELLDFVTYFREQFLVTEKGFATLRAQISALRETFQKVFDLEA